MKKLNFSATLKESFVLGLKNIASVAGAIVLWLITIWIPYLNVGTTIAIQSIPLELSKGNVISPMFIFDKKYRNLMGNYFMLQGLMSIVIFPALMFLIIPGVVIALSYSLGLYIMLDKNLNPAESLKLSNDKTLGYKWRIFFLTFIIGIITYVASLIDDLFSLADVTILTVIGTILMIAVLIAAMVWSLSLNAIIYRELTSEEKPIATENSNNEI